MNLCVFIDQALVYVLSGSEGKPCSPPATLGSGTESSSSLSPASIADDVFFSSLTEEQVGKHST